MPPFDLEGPGPSNLNLYKRESSKASRSSSQRSLEKRKSSSSLRKDAESRATILSSSTSAPTKKAWQKDRRYAVVVDAGSSGSRMQVYSWKDPQTQKAERIKSLESTRVLPTVEKGTWEQSGEDWQMKVEPGEWLIRYEASSCSNTSWSRRHILVWRPPRRFGRIPGQALRTRKGDHSGSRTGPNARLLAGHCGYAPPTR